jgi:hydrogenase maturation factor
MSGGRPLYLSAAFIIEEGLPMETLWKVISSMQQAARKSHVQIITGDTKVVDKGKGDGLFINTGWYRRGGTCVNDRTPQRTARGRGPGQWRSRPAWDGDHERTRGT